MKRRQALSIIGSGVLTAVTLGACSRELPQLPTVSASPSALPNLDSEQVQTVLDDLTKRLRQADAALSTSGLEVRVKDPALSMRQAMYNLAQRKNQTLPEISIDPTSVTVTQHDSWPRAIVALTVPSEDDLPSVLIITQTSAHDQYQLENWARLFPGRSIVTYGVAEGSPVVDNDSAEFVLSPAQALDAWVGRLNGDDDHADLLGDDEFTTLYLDENKRVTEAAKVAGTVTSTAAAQKQPLTSVRLGDDSALVAASFTQTVVYERTVAGATLKVGGLAGDFLSDSNAVTDKPVTVSYLGSVLLRVPRAGSSEKITALGIERWLQEVSRAE